MLLVSLPLGFMIKSRRLLPFFYVAAFLERTSALIVVLGTKLNLNLLIYGSTMLWGLSFAFYQIEAVPIILRNEEVKNLS